MCLAGWSIHNDRRNAGNSEDAKRRLEVAFPMMSTVEVKNSFIALQVMLVERLPDLVVDNSFLSLCRCDVEAGYWVCRVM